MMPCKKRKFSYSSYLWPIDMNPLPKIDKFSYFYHPSPFERDIIFKESLIDCTY